MSNPQEVGSIDISNDDRTGLCTIRDAVVFMSENNTDVIEMRFPHEGLVWNVELRILAMVKPE